MLTQKFRPRTFSEVAGQNLVKDLLKAIVKNPENAPKSIILEGEYGTGKTTCARILARALNCKNKTLCNNSSDLGSLNFFKNS